MVRAPGYPHKFVILRTALSLTTGKYGGGMTMRVIVAIALLMVSLVAGCAGVTNVVSTGPDTYMIASHGVMGWSSGSAQKAKAFQEADAFCKSLGKQLQPISTNETPGGGFGQIASGEVQFRCLKPDDRALQQR